MDTYTTNPKPCVNFTPTMTGGFGRPELKRFYSDFFLKTAPPSMHLRLISRTVGDVGHPHSSVSDLEPRLSKAMTWTSEFVPEDERTTVRSSPDTERLAALSEDETRWLTQLLDRLPDTFDLDELTTLIYGVPKLARGLALDDPPTDEVKADQKQFFGLLYDLLVAAPRGPRLPTLFVALGPARVRSLLGG